MNLAPNGRESNLTPEQYRLVRTPAFKKWFGDWENSPETASKVVDENGEPLVVYHGTKHLDFNTFDREENVMRTTDWKLGMDIYYHPSFFSENMNYANMFRSRSGFPNKTDNSSGRIIAVFLNIRNPNTSLKEISSHYIHIAIQKNVILDNSQDGFKGLEQGYNEIVWVALYPTQIKLADGSNTTFDGSNPDIRYADGGLINKKFYHSSDENLSLEKILFYSDEEDYRGNSFYITDDIDYSKNFGQNLYEVTLSKFNELKESKKNIKAISNYFNLDYEDFDSVIDVLQYLNDNYKKEKVRIGLVNLGFDGLIEKNKYYTQISLWNKKAIKSLTPEHNPDIRYADGGIIPKELYHYTSETNFDRIFDSNILNPSQKYGNILSFTSDSEYHKKEHGLDYGKINVRITFDNEKLISDGYSFSPFDHSSKQNKIGKEFEYIISTPIKNVKNYIKNITIFKGNAIVGEIDKTATDYANKYYLNSDIRYANGGELIKRADGHYSKRGLWDNIRANKGSGKKPTKEMLEQEAKIKNEMADGGNVENKETYKKWKSLVNMSNSELEKFYNSQEGKDAGLSSKEASEQGISSGRESARWVMKMKQTPMQEWTPTMWEWAKKQISFVSRMSGNKGGLYDDKGNKTRKHTSLLIWGHNPEKYEDGANIEKSEWLIDGKEATFEDFKEIYQRQMSSHAFDLNPKKVEYFGSDEQGIRAFEDYKRKASIYNRKGEFKESYMKAIIRKAFGELSFVKFGKAFRKHIDTTFKPESHELKKMKWSELAGYIIGDANYLVIENQFRDFANELGIIIPGNIDKKEVEHIENKKTNTMDKAIEVSTSEYKFSEFYEWFKNYIPSSLYEESWASEMRRLNSLILDNNVEEKITFTDSRLVLISFMALNQSDVTKGGMREWWIVRRYLEQYSDNNSVQGTDLFEFVDKYIGYTFTDATMNEETLGRVETLKLVLSKHIKDDSIMIPYFVKHEIMSNIKEDVVEKIIEEKAPEEEIEEVSVEEKWQGLKDFAEMMMEDAEGEVLEKWQGLYEFCELMLEK